MSSWARLPGLLLAGAGLLGCAGAARGQTFTWNKNADDSWTTAANWTPNGIPDGPGVGVVFGNAITANRTVSLNGSVTVGSISFENTGLFSYTIGGTGSLTLDNGVNPAQISIASTVLAGQTVTRQLIAAGDVNIVNNSLSGPLTLSGGVNLGGRTLKLSGVGNVNFSNNPIIGSTGSKLVLNGPGAAYLQAGNTGLKYEVNGGILVAFVNNALQPLQAGTLTPDLLTLSNGGTVNFHVQQTQANFIGISLGAGGGRIASDANAALVLSAPITGAGSLTKVGPQTIALSAVNTYTGQTMVREGTLRLDMNAPSGAVGALGNAASAVILGDDVGANSTGLLIGTNGVIIGRDITVVASPAPGASVVKIGSAGSGIGGNFAGLITLNRTVILTGGSSAAPVNYGRITGTGGLTVDDGFAVLASPASDFVGRIRFETAGWISINSDAQLGAAGNDLYFNGGHLRVTGSTPFATNRPVSLNLQTALAGGEIEVLNSDAATGFTIGSAMTGTGPLRKTGPGILTLSGANTYGTMTYVEQGILSAAAANVLSPNSTISVYAGATVRLNGFSQQVARIAHGASTSFGTIDLGSNPAAVLTVGQNGVSKQPISFEGQIVGLGDLVFTGLGSQWMGGASSFVGTTTVRQGVVELRGPVPASGNGPLGHSSGGAIRLGDASFAGLDAAITSTDKSSTGFARPITVVAGAGPRTIGHRLHGSSHDNTLVTFSGPVALEKDLHLYTLTTNDYVGADLRVSGVVSGAGGLVKIGGGEAQLTADNMYAGATVVHNGRLVLGRTAAAGSAPSSSGFVVRTDWSNPGIPLDTQVSPAPTDKNYAEFVIRDFVPSANRIGDTNVTLAQGKFGYWGQSSGASSESFANLVLDRGPNTLEVVTPLSANTTSATLSMTAGLVRNNWSTLLVRSTGLGNPDGGDFTRVVATTSPALSGGGGAAGSTNISILPWAYHSTGPDGVTVTNNFLTYGPTGLRPLAASEYVTSLTAAGTLNNVRITASATTLTQDQTINSLFHDLAPSDTVTLTGRTLTIASGAILTRSDQLTFVGGEIAFGAAEGVIHSTDFSDVTVNSVISGSGGLTVALGYGTQLTLNGANTYSGTTTINSGGLVAGGVTFNSAASFGTGLDPILIRYGGYGSTLTYSGTGPTTLAKPIEIGPSSTGFRIGNGGTLTLTGVVSGTSTNVGDAVTFLTLAPGGVFELRGVNTFAGHVRVSSGTVGIINDNNLGAAGNRLTLGGGTTNTPTLRLDGAGITVARPVAFDGHATINTNTYDATVAGPVTGGHYTSNFTKAGAGTLTLSGTNSYGNTTQIVGGTLRVNGTLSNFFQAGGVNVNNGGTLGGSGTVDRFVRVHSGGTLAPGAGPGTLTLGVLEFVSSASAAYEWEAGPSVQDRVVVTDGPVSLSGITTTLRLYDRGLGTSVTPGQQFPLYVVAGANSITGFDPTKFTVVFSDTPNWVAGQYTLALGSSGGNTILYLTNIAPVPEPAGLLAVAGAGLAVAGWRRRRGARITS